MTSPPGPRPPSPAHQPAGPQRTPPHQAGPQRTPLHRADTQRTSISDLSIRSAFAYASSAPTPQNTVFDPADDIASALPPHMVDTPVRPGLTPDSSFDAGSFASDHSAVHLIPLAVPESTRSVPAPLRSMTSRSTARSAPTPLSALTPSDVSSTKTPPPWGGVRFREREVRPVDPDTVKLRQLGYDASFGRDYTFWSSLAISWLNIGCLQGTIYAVSGTYDYGGPAMILVAWPLTALVSLPLTLTLSELASAYPVSGAMASWSWKAARLGVGGERGWGWLMGGVVLGGHIANLVLVTWETSSVIVGTIALSVDYEAQIWQQICFYLAVVAVVGSVGSTGWGSSSRYWLCAGGYGLAMWLVLCIVLLASNATKGHHGAQIVGSFYNNTGWSSRSYVYFLGWQYTSIATGFDASAHMAEETQNPSRNVPNAMTLSMIATYLLGYVSIVLLLLSMDPNDAAQLAVHAFPVGHILATAISRPGAIAICSLLVVALALQLQAQLQAASRFVFALARDHAFPFSETIAQTTSSTRQPVVATLICVALWAPFACLLIGNESSLYSVLAVCASTLNLTGYVTPVALYLLSKKDLQQEGRTSWSLRKWSRPVGLLGLLYGVAVVVSQCFPGAKPVTAATISWAPVALVGTGIICFITWRLYGDRNYSGPIRALTKWETGVEIDLQTTLNSRGSKAAATHAAGSFIHSEGGNVDASIKVSPGVTVSVGPAGAADDGFAGDSWDGDASHVHSAESAASAASAASGETVTTGAGLAGEDAEEYMGYDVESAREDGGGGPRRRRWSGSSGLEG